MNKTTVTLSMIVKDEEEFLRRCLESVTNKVDEIIIVDTGSTDSTINIAEEYGAKVFHHTWEDDFSDARNFSIEKANSEYILVLDADEYLDKDANLQEILVEKNDVYILSFKNYMDGGYVSNHQAIRLFKNNLGLKYFGKVHEHLNVNDHENLKMVFADLLIHHDGYRKETFVSRNKFERNLDILKKEVRNNPTGYNLFNLGVQYKVSENYAEALKVFKRAYPLSKDQIYLPYLLYLMGDCLLQLGHKKDGLSLLNDSIALFPSYTGFYYLVGLYYEKCNYLKEAEKAFKKCIELGEVKHFQSLEGVGSYLAYIKLSEIQQKQGLLTDALESSFSALKCNKRFLPALNQYISVLYSAGIHEDDLNDNLKKMYPISDIKDLETLIKVLYVNRSKSSQFYIDKFKLSLEKSVLAISALYNNKYAEASSLWMEEEKIDSNVYSDIISLCVVEKNKDLCSKILNKMNLNKREKKTLASLIEGNEGATQISLSSTVFHIIKKSCLCLLRLGEETVFWDFYNRMLLTEIEKEQLIGLLLQNGFLNISAQLLEEDIQISKQNNQLFGLLADIYTRQNKLNEALNMYTQLIEKIGDYASYNRMYNLYEKIKYTDGLVNLELMMDSIVKNEMELSI